MDSSCQQTVLQNLELRLAHIRSALAELTDIQTDLQKNASQSKHDIQATFSRQLESLRTREVYLLNQVDTLLQIKQEHLHVQADGLNKEIGALQALLEQARAAKRGVDLQDIEDIMKRFQQFQLGPEEYAALEFVGDPKWLKKAILSFGSINPKRFCPAKDEDVLAKPEQVMAPFEEFVEGKVWLTPKASCGTKDDTLRTVYPIFYEKQEAAGWLSREHEFPVMETCESEKSDQDSFVMILQEPEQNTQTTSAHFASILNSPNIQWMRPTSKTDNVGVGRHQQTKPACSYYRPSGTNKDWLKKDQSMETQTACNPAQVPAKPIEIEDLAEMACVQDTPSGAPNPCSPKTSSRPRTQRSQKNTTCCSSPAPKQAPAKTTAIDISEVCKGNEKCKTFEECLCDDNCADAVKGGFSGIPESSKNRWLEKKPAESTKNRDEEPKDVEVTRPDEAITKEDLVKDWLTSKTTLTEDYESAILTSFMKWQLNENPVWLKKEQSQGSIKEKSDQTNVNQWLFKKAECGEPMVVDNKKSSEEVVMKAEWLVPKTSDISAFKVPVNSSTSWLLKGKDDEKDDEEPQGSKMEVDTKQDVFQEKWLVKHTFGGSLLPSKPTGFPFFNQPTVVNQWLKK